jgi:hypothetical protein
MPPNIDAHRFGDAYVPEFATRLTCFRFARNFDFFAERVANAATIDTTALLWTIAAYVIIHQIEGNLFTPLIQRRLVLVPPAVMLLGIVAMSLLFGAAAVIFAAPIVVVVFVAVKMLYAACRSCREPSIRSITKRERERTNAR